MVATIHIPPVALQLIRIVLVPVFATAIFLVYGYVLGFLVEAIQFGESAAYKLAKIFAEGFLSASFVALIFAYPIAIVYRRYSFVVAMLMTLPVLYFRLDWSGGYLHRPVALFFAAYEVGAFVVLLVLGTFLANRHLSRLKVSIDSDTQELRELPNL